MGGSRGLGSMQSDVSCQSERESNGTYYFYQLDCYYCSRSFIPYCSSCFPFGMLHFFAFMITFGVTMVYLFLVETANRTILEIDEKFATHQIKLRRWKNAAPEDKEPLKYSSILARSDKVSDLAASKTASSNEAQPVDDEECVKTVES